MRKLWVILIVIMLLYIVALPWLLFRPAVEELYSAEERIIITIITIIILGVSLARGEEARKENPQ